MSPRSHNWNTNRPLPDMAGNRCTFNWNWNLISNLSQLWSWRKPRLHSSTHTSMLFNSTIWEARKGPKGHRFISQYGQEETYRWEGVRHLTSPDTAQRCSLCVIGAVFIAYLKTQCTAHRTQSHDWAAEAAHTTWQKSSLGQPKTKVTKSIEFKAQFCDNVKACYAVPEHYLFTCEPLCDGAAELYLHYHNIWYYCLKPAI